MISGFLQTSDKVHKIGGNGTALLYEEVWKEFVAPDVRVSLREWDVNTDNLAAWMHKNLEATARIDLYGYSWGGQAVVNLASTLNQYHRIVNNMVLVDAVARYKWREFYKTFFIPFEKQKIHVPNNVAHLEVFKQRNSKIKGGLILPPPRNQTVFKNSVHLDIDEHPDVYETWFKVLRS